MKKLNFAITSVIIIVLVAGAIFLARNYLFVAWNDYGGYHMGSGMMGYGGMGVMMLVFWGLVLVVLILLISRLLPLNQNKFNAPTDRPDAIELLKQRFAKGEIDRTEFKAKMNDLRTMR